MNLIGIITSRMGRYINENINNWELGTHRKKSRKGIKRIRTLDIKNGCRPIILG